MLIQIRDQAIELFDILEFWMDENEKKYEHSGKEIREAFEKADREIPNISISYKKDPEAIYVSRAFTFSNLTKPINSSLISSYFGKDENNEDIIQCIRFHFSIIKDSYKIFFLLF